MFCKCGASNKRATTTLPPADQAIPPEKQWFRSRTNRVVLIAIRLWARLMVFYPSDAMSWVRGSATGGCVPLRVTRRIAVSLSVTGTSTF